MRDQSNTRHLTDAAGGQEPARGYRFGKFEVWLPTRSVRRDGERRNLSQKSFELLVVLLQAAPDAVSHQELIERLWPREVVNEEALKQRVSVLRKALGRRRGAEDLIENIRGFGYRLRVPVTAFDAAPIDTVRPPTPSAWVWIRAGLAALLIVAAVAFVLLRPASPPPPVAPPSGDVRLAVLPFANLTGLESEDYFASGLTEELIGLLANSDGLRVIARTSVARYADSAMSVREIARALAVDAVVEGSVARQDDALRVNVRLVDANSEEPLWGQRFDAPSQDIFEVQTEIAGAVSLALRPGVRGGALPYRPTADLEAYEWFLRGRDAYRIYTRADNEDAIGFFRRAIELDSTFAEAHAGLANALGMKANFGAGEEYAREALHWADQALSLRPDLPEALKAKGQALQWMGREREALAYSLRALEQHPHFTLAINNAGEQLAELGRYDEALRFQLRLIRDYWRELTFQGEAANRLALTLVHLGRPEQGKAVVDAMVAGRAASSDPVYGRVFANLRLGQHRDADQEAQRASDLLPGCGPCHRLAGVTAEIAGDAPRAIRNYDLAWRLSGEREPVAGLRLARLLLEAGDGRAQDLLDKAESIDGGFIESGHQDSGHHRRLAGVHMLRGNRRQALAYFNETIDRGHLTAWLERLDPFFNALKGDPAFEDSLRRMEARLDEQIARLDADALDRDVAAVLSIVGNPE